MTLFAGWLALSKGDNQLVQIMPAVGLLLAAAIANTILAWFKEDFSNTVVAGLAMSDIGLITWTAVWAKNPAAEPHLALLIPLAIASRRLPWQWTTGIVAASLAGILWLSGGDGPLPSALPYRLMILAFIPVSVGIIGASLTRKQSEKVRHRIALNRSVLFHEFLSHLLFQVREYLTSITSVSQHMPSMIEDPKIKELAEKLARMVAELNEKVSRMFETVQSHTTTRRPARAIDFSLNDLLQEAMDLTREAFPVHTLKTKIWVDPAIPPIQGDRDMIFAISSAIIENSLEAMRETGMGSHLNISARALPEKSFAEIVVIDDAGGIPPGDVPRVLTPLFTTKSRLGGVGLGLSMSRRMLEHVGGTIEVRSENGSSFIRIVLPFSPGLPRIRNDESTWAGRRSDL
ncbi:MAG: hypothetical protein COB53_09475 [Elusimicrobia bacterium]|nr:MAG: hypothetical protein COB53_09475 [Elusimicrobiota bacterium]